MDVREKYEAFKALVTERKAEFEALPYSKQAELYTQNPKIFETLV